MANKNGQSNPDTLTTSGIQDTEDDQQQNNPNTKKLKRREGEREDLTPPPKKNQTNKKYKHEIELRCSQRVGRSCFLIRYTPNVSAS